MLPSDHPRWRRYFRFFRPDPAREVDDEIAFHLEALTDHLARTEGLSRTEAEALARRRFGDVPRLRAELRRRASRRNRRRTAAERARTALADLSLTVRRLRQHPGYALTVIGVMALGIGATITMFSVFDAALLRPLPFADPSRLVMLPHVDVPGGSSHRLPSLPDLEARPELFSRVAAYAAGGLNLADPERPVRVHVGVVTPGFFETLGATPAAGRAFADDEGRPGASPVVVLSYGFWQRQFGGDSVIGRGLQLGRQSYTVIGVMPREMSFPAESDVWIPLPVPISVDLLEGFNGFLTTSVIARLAPGVTREAATARLEATWSRALADTGTAAKPYVAWYRNDLRKNGVLVPLQRELAGSHDRTLALLLGATGLLLLVAAANATNLIVARNATRRAEVAVLMALGAPRARVAGQLLMESVLLTGLGTAVGLGLAPPAIRSASLLLPAAIATVAPPAIDLRVVAFAAAVGLATGLAVGLWPVLQSIGTDPLELIRAADGRGAGARQGRGRRALIGAELALTLPLLIGGGLTVRSLARIMGNETGMAIDQAGSLELSFSANQDDARRRTVLAAAIDRLTATAGITAAGFVNDLPLANEGSIGIIMIPDGPPAHDTAGFYPHYLVASGGYFAALGIPLLEGRVFRETDDAAGPRVAIVGRQVAWHLWGEISPLGHTFTIAFSGQPTPYTVVGVVGDVRDRGLDAELSPQVFLSGYASVPNTVALVARGGLPGPTLLGAMTAAVRDADPRQPVYRVRMMAEVVDAWITPRRVKTLLVSVFGGIGLLIAGFGVYGVVSYGVTRRTRELGIRAAIGADRRRLLRLVVGEVARTTAVGTALGLAAAWSLGRIVESQLYAVSARDPLTFVLATGLLLAAVALATLVPARRAVRVDPAAALRAE